MLSHFIILQLVRDASKRDKICLEVKQNKAKERMLLNHCTMGRNDMKSLHRVLGQSLLHSLICSHRCLICLLRTACFACTLNCTHFFARSLTKSGAYGKEIFVQQMTVICCNKCLYHEIVSHFICIFL